MVTTEGTVTDAVFRRLGKPCVLLKLGEMVLKGHNRSMFESQLRRNLQAALRDVGGVQVRYRGGVALVEPAAGVDVVRLAERAQDVMGIVWVHPAVRVERTVPAVLNAAVTLMEHARPGSFAVRPRRRDKRFQPTSEELAVLLGAEVQRAHGRPVNLSNPDVELGVEVDASDILVYVDRLAGPGGLPVGVSGKAMTMLSGGIDSVVAAYRMMKRGLGTDFVHFSGMPLTGPDSIYKAYGLARTLAPRQQRSRLWVVSFGKAQQRLASAGCGEFSVIAQRRLMLMVAERLARREGAQALVTGDSLGQVSSQTLTNMSALDASVEMLILRPLVGLDKNEIMAEARKLGTFDISSLPDEDCCTLLLPKFVTTRADVDTLAKIDRRIDATSLADSLVAAARLYELDDDAQDRTCATPVAAVP